MGNEVKTAEKKANKPLNAPNAPFGNPMQMQQNAEDQRLNNVMMLNREMEEGEQHRESLLNPQAQQVLEQGQLQAQQARPEVQNEVMSPAELMKELKNLEDVFSRLSRKEKTEIKELKGESEENKNFVARYQSRNELVKKMYRAVRLAKTKINDTNQNLEEDDFKEFNAIVKEAKTAKTEILAEDAGLKNWEIYAENKEAMNEVMDEIVEDSWFTDSGVYKDVVRAIKDYRKDASQKNFLKLQENVKTYIEIRTENYTKGEEKFRPKGRARIRRMKDLAARLGIYEQREAYKERAAMKGASKIQYKGTAADDVIDHRTEKLRNASEKMKEALESERKFATLKSASEIMISARMLTPEYIMGHLDEMKDYAKRIEDARTFVNKWNEKQALNQNQVEEAKSEREIFEEKVYRHYALATIFVSNLAVYKKLGDYIKACESGDQDKIQELRETMENCAGLDEKGEKLCREYFEDMEIRLLGVLRLEYVVGAFGTTKFGKTLSADKDRLNRMLEVVKLNEQGRFASEKDREIFEKNLEMMDTLYNGEPKQFLEIVERYVHENKSLPMDESIVTRAYMEEHYLELTDISGWDIMRQNIVTLRPDVAELFVAKYGEDYIAKMNAEDGGLGTNMAMALQNVARLNGFIANMLCLCKEVELENLSETEDMLENNMNTALNIIREHNNAQKIG